MYFLIMSLRVTILLIYCLEVKMQHTEKPQILFRFQEKYGTEFTVEKNQPLDIVLDNFFAKHAWCVKFNYSGPDYILVKHTILSGSSDSVINVPKVTDRMISRWWCTVLQQYKDGKPYYYLGHNYTAQNIVFNLRISQIKVSAPEIQETPSTFNMEIVYIVCGIGLAIILVAITVILIKKCCCKPPNNPAPQFKIDPDSVFYCNLEIFRQQYIRQLEAQEPEYEEIN
ncbi:hypothetical protein PYW07_011405 [Mythimna separata]|uniref:Uncharacterized protein n=1 Tax=Mythimna separata TaxID=271217 RepID=A0AAD8DLG1_MYTSE|nr:hypothetical protein PYW07_011405 [Mythimna separata]